MAQSSNSARSLFFIVHPPVVMPGSFSDMQKSVLFVVWVVTSSLWAGQTAQAESSKAFLAPVQTPLPAQTQPRSLLVADGPVSDQAQNSKPTKPTLMLQDLPPGFQPLSGPELAELSQSLSAGGYETESLFAFQEAEHFEYIIGFTTPLSTPEAQAAFDSELRQAGFLEQFAQGFQQGAAGIKISNKGALKNLDGIGNAIAGFGFTSNIQTIPMRIELVVFRRNQIGAFLWIMYLDGDKPVISVDQVAQKLDSRVLDAAKATQVPQVVLDQ
ncbi:hypothetical protein NDA01_05495 [Trichocoleus desertorum AS-A10]|uniref:hypothetical protein n=1 Tax=Trichocoleus desertorum TaxID=1481672 RepID=UPI00329994B3